ncbi:MAG: non-ribosomal peptide synthase/polyketide synthase [Myxococcota bacterium]
MDSSSLQAKNFVELLEARTAQHPERVAFRFLGDGENVTALFTYAELRQRVCDVAHELQSQCAPGDRVLLLYPNGPEYVIAFLACLYAGVIAVPAYPPESLQRHHVSRLIGIARDAQPRLVLTEQAILAPLEQARTLVPELATARLLASDDIRSATSAPTLKPIEGGVAFLQYTSGSTARPKGVMVSHENLIANSVAIRSAFEIQPDDVVVSWLPLFHDMGLIGALLQPIFSGVPLVLMGPRHFIERPSRWLSAVSRFGGTVSGGPDFAYRLCVERVAPEQLEGLDLSNWRLAFSGAEPVRAATLRAFADKFQERGFSAAALYPCYGLAESTLLVSGGRRGAGVEVLGLDAAALSQGLSVPRSDGPQHVACGRAQEGHNVAIIDPHTGLPCEPGRVGEIQVSGGSVALGYWNNPQATENTFVARGSQRFLRTGDLGFQHDGRLFITGRLKDMIIVRGQNLYPHDIERTIEEQIEVVRKGRVAAFSIDIDGREGIGIAAEVSRRMLKLISLEGVCRGISEVVAEEYLEAPSLVVLLQPSTLPMTTSGKLQRAACRRGYQLGTLDALAIFERGALRTTGMSPGVAPNAALASGEAPTSSGAQVHARSESERELAAIWQELLELPRVSADDRFFALGGNSLKAVQMLARVASRFGVRVELAKLFEKPSLGALAAEIEHLRSQPGSAETGVLVQPRGDGKLPLSFGEQRLWFLWQLDRESAAYTMAEGLEWRGPLDTVALERSFTWLAARHEALRTTFAEDAGKPYRVVHAHTQGTFTCEDLSALGPGEREQRARALAEQEANAGFDLEAGPLWRVRCLRLENERHVVLVCVHHILSDGWSLRVLLEELGSAYAKLAAGEQPALAALPIQCADYAIWQRRTLAGTELERQLGFWKAALGTEHPVLELPLDRPRPLVQSQRGDRYVFRIDAALTSELRRSAREQQITPFMLLLAAFQCFLHRSTGQSLIRVGVPVANRSRLECERLIGFLVNTLVLEANFNGLPDFQRVLASTKDDVLSAQAHQDLPFEVLVDALNVERTLRHNPLFQVMFNHLGVEYASMPAPAGVTWIRLELGQLATQFDLTLDTYEEHDSIRAVWTYATDLFDVATLRRFTDDFLRLLAQLLSTPTRPIAAIPMLDWATASSYGGLDGSGKREYPFESGYIGLFEAQVQESGGKVAARCGEEELSYAELNRRANRIGWALVGAGVQRGELVALLGERGLGFLSMMVGVFKAGAAYVPLDSKHPAERTGQILGLSKARVVLVERARVQQVEAALERLSEKERPRVLVLEEVLSGEYSEEGLGIRVRSNELAYVIWTSGSTGVPKGAMVTSAGMLNNQLSKIPYLGLSERDVIAQTAGTSFDISVWQFLAALLFGGRVEIVPEEIAQDGVRLLGYVKERGVTVLESVPSLIQGMLSEGGQGELGALRWMLPTGEALPPETARRWFEKYAGVPLVNAYGPAECADDVALYRMERAPEAEVVHLAIGSATDNNRLYVVNEALQLVAPGVTGELCVAGVGVGRGYLGDAARTAEVFVPNPHGPAGERLYRTGDLARYRSDGVLEYVGRRDQQVKIRGYRIELGEIEARLLAQPEVEAACVLAREDALGVKRLVAYIVLRTCETSDAELRAQLGSRLAEALPEYMVPRLFVFLEVLPLTRNGKVDRKALPAPDLTQAQRAYVAPESWAERTLAEVWRNVLKIERVGLSDNFFELGGDSIMALQVVGQAKRLGLALKPKDLFQHQTLATLSAAAVRIETSVAEREASATHVNAGAEPTRFPLSGLSAAELAELPVPLDNIEDVFPLSPMQEGMLLHTLLEPGSGIYFMQDQYRIDAEIEPACFLRAWERVIQRHPALRACFTWQFEGKLLQIIQRRVDSPVQYLDWRDVSAEEQQTRLRELLREERESGFDLRRAPLLRLRLVRVAEHSYYYVESHHHILVDDWCRSLMLVDFFAEYRAQLEGTALVRPDPPLFRDFIAWLKRQDKAAARQYWGETLEGFEAATSLGIDRPLARDSGTSRVADRFVELSEQETQRLAQLARERQLTVNTFAQGAWAWLLSQYSGSKDVVFGVTVAGRPAEIENIQETVGLFINSLPLRVRFPRAALDLPAAEWLRQLQAQNVAMREHEHLSLLDIQRCSVIPYGQPLFRCLFVFENAPLDASLFERQIEFGIELAGNRTHTNFPITVVVIPNRQLRLVISYDERFVEEAAVLRMLAEFKAYLLALLAAPDAKLSSLLTVGSDEARRLVTEWNRSEREYPFESGYIGLFEAQVQESGGKIAARCGEEELSYAELNRRANRIGWALVGAGVQRGELVALLGERGLGFLSMMVGVFKAGAAYVPLDSKHPAERTGQILGLSKARVVLVERARVQQVEAALERLSEKERPRVLVLEEVLSGEYSEEGLGIRVRSNELAYVIWTSGSTGVPKGAMVTSAGMLNNQLSKIPYLGLSERDVIAQTAGTSFDISVWQFLAALLFGGRVEIVPEEIAQDGVRLLGYVKERGVTVLESVPSLIQGMLSEGGQGELGALRWMLPTGEALPPETARRWFEKYAGVPLVNAYGPAECADDVALYRMERAPEAEVVHLAIGSATDNNRLYVVNEALQLVAPGVTGELCVAGVGVGRGYLGDAARTAEVFVPNPHGPAGERLYRTGDLARYRSDGVLEYVGRRDQQVKIRGYRIELGEIEARLSASSLVREAAVDVWSGSGGDKRLVGYVAPVSEVPQSGSAAEVELTEQLRAELLSVLPEYMVPRVYVFLGELPMNANGKLDRKALPAPTTAPASQYHVPPEGELEQELASIWQEVLGVARVGRHDDFFELGGHSLLATQVVSRVSKRFDLELELAVLFEAKTLAGLAARLPQQRPIAATVPALARADRSQPLPLSFAQQRLWFLWRLEPESAAYNIATHVRLSGELNYAALQQSFAKLIERHESLRTRFETRAGRAYQVVDAERPFALHINELGGLAAELREARARELGEREARTPFDLERDDLMRVKLVKLSISEHLLLVTMHHIISDEWSMNLLIDEFVQLYSQCCRAQGKPAALPELAIQYADYAVWQRQWLESAESERQLAYWKSVLGAEQPKISLPTDRQRPQAQSYAGATLEVTLDSELCGCLRRFAQERSLTPFMVLLATYRALLFRYSGQSDVCIGVPIANRHRVELEPLIGFFVNTLVLRLDCNEKTTFNELLELVKRRSLEAQAHQDLPFEKLVEALNPARSLSHSPLFQVMFNHLRPEHDALAQVPGLAVTRLAPEQGTTQFDLSLDTEEDGDALRAEWTYSRDLFDHSTIERLARDWSELLRAALAEPQRRISALPLQSTLTPASVGLEIAGCEAYQLGYVARFEQCVARHPERVLVREGEALLSYAELNRRANRVGHALRDRGVDKEVVVAILARRTSALLAAAVGVLKAGAVYLPLDPEHPPARLAEILRSSRAQVVVSASEFEPLLRRAFELYRPLTTEDAPQLLLLESLATSRPDWQHNLGIYSGPSELVYLIYTSGSTGTPKGALVEQAGMLNNQLSKVRRFELGERDIIAQTASQCFDISVWQLLTAGLCGASVDIVPDAVAKDPEALLPYVAARGITILEIVPSLLRAGLASTSVAAERLALRYVLPTGEELPRDLVECWFERYPNISLVNAYGPAECADDVALHLMRAAPPVGERVPIGSAVDFTQLFVVDAALNLVPPGVTGELCVAGVGVGRGYASDPARTAEAFLPNPFSLTPGARLYRTGDRARVRADGLLEYAGRADHQTKLRGYRIELGEIEARLLRLELVHECVVIVDVDRAGHQRLIAYIVPQPNQDLLVDAGAAADAQRTIRAELAAALPDYMVPQFYVFLRELPLSPNGKIDRRALPRPEATTNTFVEPRLPSERSLATVWQEVLGVARVGLHDNFFELGGDSIVAIQVVAHAARAGLKITPKQIFEYQSLAALASVAETAEIGETSEETPAGGVPLTPIQAWFFQQELPDPHHYNQSLLLEVGTSLDMARLEQALERLVTHHDSLRLRYQRGEHGWQQRYAESNGSYRCSRVDLSAQAELDQAELEGVIMEHANRAQRSLDIAVGPLLHAAYLDLGAQRSGRLLLVIHHNVVDGVSWRILLEDLERIYGALSAGEAPMLPQKTSSFQRWAQCLHEYAMGPALSRELPYWRDLLSTDTSADRLPIHYPEGSNTVGSSKVLSRELDERVTEALLTRAHAAYRTHINDLLLTALADVLCRWSGQASLLLQLEGHGRQDLFADVDLSRTVGWFSTLHPIRLTPDRRGPAASILAVKEQLRATPNGGIGYGVLRYLGAARELEAPQPLVNFNYLGQFDQTFEGEALFQPARESPGEECCVDGLRSVWFDVSGSVYRGRLQLSFEFSTNLHHEAEIRALLDSFAEAVERLVEHCLEPEHGGVSSSDFPLARLTRNELEQLPLPARQIEDVYPLSPMQQGMLFHGLLDPKTGVYVNQHECELNVALDAHSLERAWQEVIEQHPILRSIFVWDGLSRPMQVVCRTVKLPFQLLDYRSLSASEQRAELERFLVQDRELGFELQRAPLMRIGLVRLAERRYHFVWTEHHLLLDGWSASQLLEQVFARYAGLTNREGRGRIREANEFPSLAYRRYIAWLEAQDAERAAAHWRGELSSFETPSLLASSWRPPERTEGHEVVRRALPQSLVDKLILWGKGQHLTFNSVMQGALAFLISSYTRQADVLFGTTVSGRSAPLPGIETALGLFINTLPLRVCVDGSQSLTDWLRELQARSASLRDFEYTSLAELQGLTRVVPGNALFDSLLVFENYPVGRALESSAEELGVGPVRSIEATNYPLTFVVSQGEGVTLELGYDTALVTPARAAELLEQLEQLLFSFLSRPHVRVGELSLLAEQQRARQLREFNSTARTYPGASTVLELFERRVQESPDAPALCFGEHSVSYGALNQRANRLGRRLRQLGVGPDVLVGVYLERSIEMVVALLGVWKAGGAYLPLDPEYPAARTKHALTEARPKVVLSATRWLDPLPSSTATLWCFDRDEQELSVLSSHNLPHFFGPQNLAYCIYTSGSTGTPKGAVNTHAGLYNRLQWMQEAYALATRDRVLQKTPFSFDVSVWEFFWPLMTGATLVVAPPGAHRDPAELAAIIRNEGITTLHFVPSMLKEFVRSGELESCTSVRRLLCSGEALPYDLEQEVLRRHPTRLYNLYGPTEASIDVTAWNCQKDELQGVVPIGLPIANTGIFILDSHLQPAPLGALGELYISGIGLARGYVSRPDLTAERFVPNPYAAPGERLYRTGDLARYREDGTIEYAGRVDHQVKIRGNRIELGEIEARLHEHPRVQAAAASAISDATGETWLIAYVVSHASEGAACSSDDLRGVLRDHLKRSLPAFMVPEFVVVLESMPLNANGKLDRKALVGLAGLELPDLVQRRAYVAPRNDLERELQSLWCELLKLEQVGIDDDFFDLGGHSLLATQLASRIRRDFQAQLSLRQVFEASSIRAQAQLLANAAKPATSAAELGAMQDLLNELEQAD